MTAATMFMDVTTDFGGKFVPTQADHAERGPVRLRSALQFSLNIPSIKAGIMNGLNHFYRPGEGLRHPLGAEIGPGRLDEHRDDRDPPDRHDRRLRRDRRRRQADAADDDPQGDPVRRDGRLAGRPSTKKPKPKTVISPQAAYIITDILTGNTEPKTNTFWGEWAIYDKGVRRPAAYKTGTTNDNRDVHAYGFLAPPKDPKAPALVVGVWMGNSNNEPDRDTLSLGLVGTALVADPDRGQPGHADRRLQAPKGSSTRRSTRSAG